MYINQKQLENLLAKRKRKQERLVYGTKIAKSDETKRGRWGVNPSAAFVRSPGRFSQIPFANLRQVFIFKLVVTVAAAVFRESSAASS